LKTEQHVFVIHLSFISDTTLTSLRQPYHF